MFNKFYLVEWLKYPVHVYLLPFQFLGYFLPKNKDANISENH